MTFLYFFTFFYFSNHSFLLFFDPSPFYLPLLYLTLPTKNSTAPTEEGRQQLHPKKERRKNSSACNEEEKAAPPEGSCVAILVGQGGFLHSPPLLPPCGRCCFPASFGAPFTLLFLGGGGAFFLLPWCFSPSSPFGWCCFSLPRRFQAALLSPPPLSPFGGDAFLLWVVLLLSSPPCGWCALLLWWCCLFPSSVWLVVPFLPLPPSPTYVIHIRYIKFTVNTNITGGGGGNQCHPKGVEERPHRSREECNATQKERGKQQRHPKRQLEKVAPFKKGREREEWEATYSKEEGKGSTAQGRLRPFVGLLLISLSSLSGGGAFPHLLLRVWFPPWVMLSSSPWVVLVLSSFFCFSPS